MPVVPMSRSNPTPAPAALPDEKYFMMAAAQMHKEGRLVQEDSEPQIPAMKHEELRRLLEDIKSSRPKLQNRVAPPPTEPPQEYWPSSGQRDRPAMMT